MGNCVGHSGSDSKQKNKQQLSPGVTTLKNNETTNQESEQEKQNTLKDPKGIEEPISKNSTNLTPKDDMHKAEINRENVSTISRDVKLCTNTTTSPKDRDTVPNQINETATEPVGSSSKTSGEISTQNEQEKLKRSSDENEVEITRDKMDFKTEKGDAETSNSTGYSNAIQYLPDTTNSVAANHTNDNMERQSLTSSKSFIDSDDNVESFEKMVLSACFSENVRNAFVLDSEKFVNPWEKDCTKCENDTNAVTQHTDVTENEPATKDKDSDSTGCYSEYGKESCHNHETAEDISDKEISDKDSDFTACYSECEKRGCHKQSYIDLEDILVNSSTTTENEFDMNEDIERDKEQWFNDSNFTACCMSDTQRTDMAVNCGHENSMDEEVFQSCNLNQETESVDYSSYDICEETALNETLLHCKIDKETSCECFEQGDMDCCCQCCESSGKHV